MKFSLKNLFKIRFYMLLKAKINFRLVLIARTCPSRLKQFDLTCGSRLILLVEADWSYLSSRGSRLIVLVPYRRKLAYE